MRVGKVKGTEPWEGGAVPFSLIDEPPYFSSERLGF